MQTTTYPRVNLPVSADKSYAFIYLVAFPKDRVELMHRSQKQGLTPAPPYSSLN